MSNLSVWLLECIDQDEKAVRSAMAAKKKSPIPYEIMLMELESKRRVVNLAAKSNRDDILRAVALPFAVRRLSDDMMESTGRCSKCGHGSIEHRDSRCRHITDGEQCHCFALGPGDALASRMWHSFVANMQACVRGDCDACQCRPVELNLGINEGGEVSERSQGQEAQR